MSKKVPDAWDDDWESLADKPATSQAPPDPAPTAPPKLSKAQRRAQHAEQQKQLWDSAENPDRFHWLEAQGVVPLKQEFKPQLKVLSRKPAAPVIAKKDAADGVAKLNLDDDADSEEEDRKRREADMEERQRQAKVLREEKQRKYAEARERIMGSPNPGQSAPSAPSRDNSHARNGRDVKARVNGRAGGSQPTSSADQSPARPASGVASGGKELLFDPDDMGRRLPRKDTNVVKIEDGPSRQPRGPESSGRGGFGFAGRGGGVIS